MPMATTDGKYRGQPTQWMVDESKNGAAVFVCQWRLDEYFDGSDWVACEDCDITSWTYLEKKDGALNDIAITQLVSGLGWDGTDITELHEGDWSGSRAMLTLAFEHYNGEDRLKVKWIASVGGPTASGLFSGSDAKAVSGIASRLNRKLKAVAATAPESKSAKPKAAPAPKAKAAPAPKPPANKPGKPKRDPAIASVQTRDDAWTFFSNQFNDDEIEVARQWDIAWGSIGLPDAADHDAQTYQRLCEVIDIPF